jgi:beta-galactosidase/beta-glucuronidase
MLSFYNLYSKLRLPASSSPDPEVMEAKERTTDELSTDEQHLLDGYPRPDWLRKRLKWKSLNGPWNFAFDDDDVGLKKSWQSNGLPREIIKQITVPFVFQSSASGISDRGAHELLWYSRTIKDLRHKGERKRNDRLLLRFGAVDYECKIWIDGIHVGGHRGGQVPFEVDITDCWSENDQTEKSLVVRVFDSAYDLMQPRGKQYWKPEPEDIWYTPSSGIWQNVWLEVVPSMRIGDSSAGTVVRSNDIDTGTVKATIGVLGRRRDKSFAAVEISAKLRGATISWTDSIKLSKESDDVNLELDLKIEEKMLQQRLDEIEGRQKDENDATWDHRHLPDDTALFDELQKKGLNERVPRRTEDIPGWKNGLALWSPEHPNLYELTIRLHAEGVGIVDEVKMWIGVRSLDWSSGDGTFRLNGEPYFQALVLDQGYWPETLMTPPNRSALKDDIILAKNMGFNGSRKHQKIEDPIFVHYADKLGYLVWGEIGNAYDFDQRYVERFNQEWREAVRRDINHASVITWTPVNESWGYTDLLNNETQRNHIKSLYYMTK